MRLGDRILVAAHGLASSIDGITDHRHLTTDPECKRHQPVKTGTRLDRNSRGLSCTPCLVRRAFAADDESNPSKEDTNARD